MIELAKIVSEIKQPPTRPYRNQVQSCMSYGPDLLEKRVRSSGKIFMLQEHIIRIAPTTNPPRKRVRNRRHVGGTDKWRKYARRSCEKLLLLLPFGFPS